MKKKMDEKRRLNFLTNNVNKLKSENCFDLAVNKLVRLKFNKSQASVFIIFAVVLVIAVSLAYVINKNISQSKLDKEYFESAEVKLQVNNIRNSVQNCMNIITEIVLFKIGIQGGYYKVPNQYEDLGWIFIPYYYKKGVVEVPTKEKIESKISDYVDDDLPKCLNNINQEGFELKYEKPKTKTIITKGQVIFNIDLPLSININGKTATFESKETPIIKNVKLYEILEVRDYIVSTNKDEEKTLCITCLSKMSEERGLKVDIINNRDDSKLYTIYEETNETETYDFKFLEEYEGGDINVTPKPK